MKTGIAGAVAGFFPGYFALIMATGIVSLAAHFEGLKWVARGLFWLNLVCCAALWMFTVLRFVRFRNLFMADLTHHSRGATFLTKAAATCVLGCQFAILTPWLRIAEVLWIVGAALAIVLSYTFFVAVTFCEPKPSLENGINGAWLLGIVAAESVSVLGSLVAPVASPGIVLFISLATFLVGAMLYMFFATLIMYRWMFFSMKPEKLTPDYWIDMGALAITTLAGALLLKSAAHWDFLGRLESFLTGSTLFFWATATWWIPLLLLVELWRHLRGGVPFNYGPEYWAMVFPLGMYATATFMLVEVTGLTFLTGIAEAFTFIALTAWITVFAGMIHRLVRFMHPKTARRSAVTSRPRG